MQNKIPPKFSPWFWEYDFSKLEIKTDKYVIISRLLEKGQISHVKWVFSIYSDQEIREVVSESKNISNDTKNFWQIYFEYEDTLQNS